MEPTDDKEIESIIINLKQNKSTGIDNIRAKALKRIAKFISPLKYIFYQCLDMGVWPESFKNTIVVLIYKKETELK